MGPRWRLVLLIVFETVLLGLCVAAARLWVGDSWRQVIEICALFLLMLLGCEATRRRRVRRTPAARR